MLSAPLVGLADAVTDSCTDDAVEDVEEDGRENQVQDRSSDRLNLVGLFHAADRMHDTRPRLTRLSVPGGLWSRDGSKGGSGHP